MTAQEIAAKALKILPTTKYYIHLESVRAREYVCLFGFFEGIADGTIDKGQAWPVRILSGENVHVPSDIMHMDQEESDVLREIFASGICCEGQDLGPVRGKSFTERSV